jgi:catechol 2,3-dioxygenase-like lactoylglutathione lyase family enzyme
MAACSCCGKEREHVAALGCHPEVAVCGTCIAWLRSSLPRSVESTPILAVADLDEAEAFWAAVDQDVRRWEGGGYAFVGTDESVVDLGEEDEAAAGGGTCYLQVGDVDLWHSGWTAAGFEPSAIEVMPWGMREFRIADPWGNTIRVGQPAPG